jgi:hypothetical protein
MTSLAFVREVFENESYETTFRHSKSISDLCKRITPYEFQLSLEIAIHAIESAKESAHSLEYNEILTHEIEKKTRSLQNSFLTQKKELDDQILSLRSSLSKSEDSIAAMKKGSDELLRIALSQKEESFQKEILRMKDSQERLISSLEKSHKESIARADAQYAATMELLKEQESRLRKDKISSEKGKQGEKEFATLASEYYSWGSSLINTSKTPHSADLKGSIRGCDTLFEIKHYSSDVPTKELEKFERDLSENSNIPFGVFISLTSGITGKKDSFVSSKWTSKSQLLLFISNFYEHDSKDSLSIIDTCADIAFKVWNASDMLDEHTTSDLSGKLEQIKVLVDMEMKSIADFSRSLLHDKKFLTDKLNESFTRYTSYVSRFKSVLSQILDLLVDPVGDITPAQEDAVPTPRNGVETPSKKKSKKKSADGV